MCLTEIIRDFFVCIVGVWQLPNTKNITSNFSQARSTLPDNGSQTIRNMSE